MSHVSAVLLPLNSHLRQILKNRNRTGIQRAGQSHICHIFGNLGPQEHFCSARYYQAFLLLKWGLFPFLLDREPMPRVTPIYFDVLMQRL